VVLPKLPGTHRCHMPREIALHSFYTADFHKARIFQLTARNYLTRGRLTAVSTPGATIRAGSCVEWVWNTQDRRNDREYRSDDDF
jgi:hypothetical protein